MWPSGFPLLWSYSGIRAKERQSWRHFPPWPFRTEQDGCTCQSVSWYSAHGAWAPLCPGCATLFLFLSSLPFSQSVCLSLRHLPSFFPAIISTGKWLFAFSFHTASKRIKLSQLVSFSSWLRKSSSWPDLASFWTSHPKVNSFLFIYLYIFLLDSNILPPLPNLLRINPIWLKILAGICKSPVWKLLFLVMALNFVWWKSTFGSRVSIFMAAVGEVTSGLCPVRWLIPASRI